MEHIVFQIAAVVLLGIACQWVAWWTKLPAILFLLLTGLLIGPVIGWLDPDAVFGPVLLPIVSLAVAVILFEGALTLRFADIRGLERVVRRMVSSGLLVTWLVLALAAHYLVGFGWEVALLFGALVVVTGPTVIVPMLRTVRPTARIAELLRWEGIVIDPIGALLAVLVFEFIVASGEGQALLHTLATFARMLRHGHRAGRAGRLAARPAAARPLGAGIPAQRDDAGRGVGRFRAGQCCRVRIRPAGGDRHGHVAGAT